MTGEPALVGASVTGVAALWGWRLRPAPRRARRLVVAGGGTRRAASTPPAAAARPARGSVVVWLGGALRGLSGRPPDRAADRRLGWAVLLAAPALVVSPVLVLPVVGWWWAAPILARRRDARRRDATVLTELPEVVDLFVLAVGAGLTVALAVPAVAQHQRGLIADALADVARRVALGERLADALAALPDRLGEQVRPLAGVLVSSERYGVALLPALERLAHDTRLARRRAAEAAARRVPVKLLFPLVLCTLPAFALLTVVPLLAGSLRSLRL